MNSQNDSELDNRLRIIELENQIETMQTELTELKEIIQKDLNQIMEALDRLDAPPSTDEAPVVTKLEKRLKKLETRVDRLWNDAFPR